MKTKEELNALKKEVEAVNKKLRELNAEEELAEVVGGREDFTIKPKDEEFWHSWNPSPVMSPGTQDVETFIGKFKTPYSGNTDENV